MTTPIVPTEDPTDPLDVAGSPGAPAAQVRTRRRRRSILVVVVPLAVLVAAAFLVPLPYYLVSPGSVRPAEQRIDISGAESFPSDGEVLFTTIFESQATPALLVRAWMDDAVEIKTRDELYPDGDIERSRRESRQRMDISKLVATKVALGYVGIEAEFDARGARVLGVVEDGPSDGLVRLDDVIVEVDGDEVGMPADIAEHLGDRDPGDRVEVVVDRGGRETELDLTLGAAPDEVDRPILGVEVEPADPVVASPVSVRVDSGKVSGPSAGLAWTLAIIDRLTPGSLTDGRRVAVTGQIYDDGTVGPIGGLPQKVSAVRRAGVELFIYPEATSREEEREMRRIAGDAVELHAVSTIDEAVEVLQPGGVDRPD